MIEYARQQHRNKGLVCETCRKRHDENDSIAPCDAGKYDDAYRDPEWPDWIDHTRCPERRIILLPENRLAWELYWIDRSPAAAVLRELEPRQFDVFTAADIAWRIHVIAGIVAELEMDEIKKAESDAKRKR